MHHHVINRSTVHGILCMCLCFALSAFGIEVSGNITRDARWTAEDSPYIITGDIIVAPGVRLAISAGAVVKINALTRYEPSMPQYDHLDSQTIKIAIQGTLVCEGKGDKPVTFMPAKPLDGDCQWYGIVFDKAAEKFCEVAFVNITGACNAITMRDCGIMIRNSVFEKNNIGVVCGEKGNGRIYQCIFAGNYTAGIQVTRANPVIQNSIIVFNRQNGIWCDGTSQIDCRFNCIFGNSDQDVSGCDPRLLLNSKKNGNKDSTDAYGNLHKNPVFAGSEADSMAFKRDITLPTGNAAVTDTALANVLRPVADSSRAATPKATTSKPVHRAQRYTLSKYSPCKNSGNPAGEFKDKDGSLCDMGIWGGPEIIKTGK